MFTVFYFYGLISYFYFKGLDMLFYHLKSCKFFDEGSVSTKADNCPNERELIVCSFHRYRHLYPYICFGSN